MTARVAAMQLRRALLDHSVAAIAMIDAKFEDPRSQQPRRGDVAPPSTSISGLKLTELPLHEDQARFIPQHFATLRASSKMNIDTAVRDNQGKVRWSTLHGVMLDPEDPNSDTVWTRVNISTSTVRGWRSPPSAAASEDRARALPGRRAHGGPGRLDHLGQPGPLRIARHSGHPDQLIGLSHETLCERLARNVRRGCIDPIRSHDGKAATVEVEGIKGHTLEIDWLPISMADTASVACGWCGTSPNEGANAGLRSSPPPTR